MRNLAGAACNVLGTSELKNNECQCKPGYTGGFCEECTNVIDHVDGTKPVNNITGEGVRCLGKIAAKLAKSCSIHQSVED